MHRHLIFFFNHVGVAYIYIYADMHLWGTVATVDDDIGSSSVAGRIASKVQESTLEFFGHTFAAHGNLGLPEIVSLFGNEVGDLGSNVSGGNGVGTSELGPLNGERLDYISC
jgi:hypothetical protein